MDLHGALKTQREMLETRKAVIDELIEMLEYMIYHEPSEGDIKAAEKLIKKYRSK